MSSIKTVQQYCAACHGLSLEGNKVLEAPRLIGGRHSLATSRPIQTVESYWPYATTLFDYIRRAMPFGTPGSLKTNEIYSLTAYILGEAGIVQKNSDLDRNKLLKIEMPNKNGFLNPFKSPSVNKAHQSSERGSRARMGIRATVSEG